MLNIWTWTRTTRALYTDNPDKAEESKSFLFPLFSSCASSHVVLGEFSDWMACSREQERHLKDQTSDLDDWWIVSLTENTTSKWTEMNQLSGKDLH